MSDLPQISEAEFEVMKIVWKHAPISTCLLYTSKTAAVHVPFRPNTLTVQSLHTSLLMFSP